MSKQKNRACENIRVCWAKILLTITSFYPCTPKLKVTHMNS
jgi:hypothetical protein